MQYAVVHLQGSSVHFRSEGSTSAETEVKGDPSKPGPIMPELKELYWGAGSFVVFAILMRVVLYPRLKKGMTARYQGIRSAHETADAERATARAEVAEYESQLAGIKAEAAKKVEAARQAAKAQIREAVSDVAGRAGELATGKRPSADVVNRVVQEVMAK